MERTAEAADYRHGLPGTARLIRALAADRDRLLAGLEKMMDLPTTEEEVEIDDLRQERDRLAAALDLARAEHDRSNAQRDALVEARNSAIADRDRLAQEVKDAHHARQWINNAHLETSASRDALARRIEAMQVRKPTDAELMRLREVWLTGFNGDVDSVLEAWRRLFLTVRDALLATPESEPLSEPRCGLATASEPSDGPVECYHNHALRCSNCGMNVSDIVPAELAPKFQFKPQPSPATPSAEDVEWWRQWFLAQDEIPIDYAQGLAERLSADVSKREAGLRAELGRERAEIKALCAHRDSLKKRLAAARAKLDPERERLIADYVDACTYEHSRSGNRRDSGDALAAYERTRKEGRDEPV